MSAKRSSSIVRVGLTQMSCGPDVPRNRARQIRLLEQAAKRGAQVACTQELFASQYFCQVEDHRFFDLAEPIPGPGTRAISKLAKKHRMVVIASLFERRTQGLYHNTAVVIDADGSIKGIYRKMHIPDDPLYYEKFYFTPGDTGFIAHDTSRGKLGVLVCWDQWFPEGARLTAMQGAQILFYPTAIGWHPGEKKEYGKSQYESWELMMRSHAVANGCFVVAPNRVGLEIIKDSRGKPVNKDGIEFWGQSFVCAPNGQIIAKASDKDEVLVVDCDLDEVEFSRTHWPFLRDRRIDAYADLTKRFVDEAVGWQGWWAPHRGAMGDVACSFCGKVPADGYLLRAPERATVCRVCLDKSQTIIGYMNQECVCEFCGRTCQGSEVVEGPGQIHLCKACIEAAINKNKSGENA